MSVRTLAYFTILIIKKSSTKISGFSRPTYSKCLVFHRQGETEGIRSSDTYIMTDVRRNATGEYKCSLIDKSMMDSTTITVHCKSLNFALLGRTQHDLGMAPLLCVRSLVQLPTGEALVWKCVWSFLFILMYFCLKILTFSIHWLDSFTSWTILYYTILSLLWIVYYSITLSHTVRILLFYLSLMWMYIGQIPLFQLCLRMYTNMDIIGGHSSLSSSCSLNEVNV